MQDWGEIHEVGDILNAMKPNSDRFKEFKDYQSPDSRFGTHYKTPFGIWFRGQTNANWTLMPAVLRSEPGVYVEETSMFHHFQLRVPEYHQTHRATFDWLCLMQHYEIPTRLLDWTESMIIALFFAVEDTDASADNNTPEEGRLYVLNARRLNECTTDVAKEHRGNICTPDSFDTEARAQLSRARNMKRWKEHMILLSNTRIRSWMPDRLCGEPVDKEWLSSPVAVIPSRLNGRMVFQSSAFTIHGGKVYPPGTETAEGMLPKPRCLEEINEEQSYHNQFLASFRIPVDCKDSIKEELFALGIHTGSLFPELDKQAAYLRKQWQFDM